MSLRDHCAIIKHLAEPTIKGLELHRLLDIFLSVEQRAEKIVISEEIETEGWQIRRITIDDCTATIAYDQILVRCLCVKIGSNKPVSALYADISVVEDIFTCWIKEKLASSPL